MFSGGKLGRGRYFTPTDLMARCAIAADNTHSPCKNTRTVMRPRRFFAAPTPFSPSLPRRHPINGYPPPSHLKGMESALPSFLCTEQSLQIEGGGFRVGTNTSTLQSPSRLIKFAGLTAIHEYRLQKPRNPQ